MAVRKTREIERALMRKGFKRADKHHRYFTLHINGKKTSIRTKLSHGKSEYGEPLLNQMAKQLKLDKRQFFDLLDCPLSYDGYVALLKKQGDIG